MQTSYFQKYIKLHNCLIANIILKFRHPQAAASFLFPHIYIKSYKCPVKLVNIPTTILIMLQVLSEQYWPPAKGSPETYGKYTVELTAQKNTSDYIIRKMYILSESLSRMSVPQNGLSVTHIQYLKWMEDSVPTITSPVLEISNLIQSIQMGSGNRPIVVMCKYATMQLFMYINFKLRPDLLKAIMMLSICDKTIASYWCLQIFFWVLSYYPACMELRVSLAHFSCFYHDSKKTFGSYSSKRQDT